MHCLSFFSPLNEARIQNPVKHLRWSIHVHSVVLRISSESNILTCEDQFSNFNFKSCFPISLPLFDHSFRSFHLSLLGWNSSVSTFIVHSVIPRQENCIRYRFCTVCFKQYFLAHYVISYRTYDCCYYDVFMYSILFINFDNNHITLTSEFCFALKCVFLVMP